ncbi:TPA: hypothetical protein ENX78_05910 [Candidatus Poribacteria bacterium]|nr:hypothetical protein [Candidatus Poribacteria bacterium]
MFTPEKMSFVNISTLDSNLTQVLDCVTKLGIMHIVDKKDLPINDGLLKDVDIQPLKDKLSEINVRINNLLSEMGIDTKYLPTLSKSQSEIEIDPFQVASKVENELTEIESEINPIIQRIAQLQSEMNKLEKDSKQLHSLEVHGINLEDLLNMRFLYFAFGDIPVEFEHFRRLIDSLERIPCVVLQGETVGNRQQILVFSLMTDKDIIVNALEGAYFSKIDIPQDYQGSIPEILDKIEYEIWSKREDIAELRGEIQNLRRTWRKRLLELRTEIIVNQNVAESMERFGKTERSYFICGWVPYKEVGKLKKELEKMDSHSVLMNATEAITAQESEHYRPKVPTKFVHPFFLRPFTGLITTFDIPRYSAIDPTVFVSLSFMAMFGIMFADVGHGSVLFLIGLLASVYPLPQLKPLRRMFAFLSCCGAASIITGLLFGNLFGKEGILTPLWFSLEHMEPTQVNRMLSVGVYFGIGMISLGVLLSIAQHFRSRNLKEAFFGQWGVSSIIAYWLIIYLYISKSQFSWDKVLIIVLLLLPIMFKQPISKLISKDKQSHHGQEEEHGESLIESGFQIYEVALAYLANTLSYIRVAAFDLSHAGLMMAAYSLTKGQSLFLSLPSDIASNIFVIMLEGLIVGIQCMRLEYYEFFSKFFAGEGIEYKPLKIT